MKCAMIVNVFFGVILGALGPFSLLFSKDIKPNIEQVELRVKESDETSNVLIRHGILTLYPEAQGTVILCHGFMCDKYDIGFLKKMLSKNDLNTFVFDFRAHGDNGEGQVSTFGKYEAYEVLAAVALVRDHPQLKGKPVLVYGFSMGAVAAIEAAALFAKKHNGKQLFDGMVLDCPFASSEKIIQRGLDGLNIELFGKKIAMPGKELLKQYAFHPWVQGLVKYILKAVASMDSKSINTMIYQVTPFKSVESITVPCFFIHCRNDEKIPIEDAMSIYHNANGYKRLWITNGRRHYDSFFFNPEEYKMRVRQFITDLLTNRLQEPKELIVYD